MGYIYKYIGAVKINIQELLHFYNFFLQCLML